MLRDMYAADILTSQTYLAALDLMFMCLNILNANSIYLSVEDVDAALMKH